MTLRVHQGDGELVALWTSRLYVRYVEIVLRLLQAGLFLARGCRGVVLEHSHEVAHRLGCLVLQPRCNAPTDSSQAKISDEFPLNIILT